jgi:hypothetical protein
MGEAPSDEPAELVAIVGEGAAVVAPQADVHVAAGASTVGDRLGHEGDAQPLLVGHLLRALLVDDVAIRHLQHAGVADVDLVLSHPPLALAGLDRHA